MSNVQFQSAYNGMMSGQRNMILLSSVAIVMIGFIKNKSMPALFNILAILLLVLASIIGIKASHDFDYVIYHSPVERFYDINSWRQWKYVAYIYSTFLLLLASYLVYDMTFHINMKAKK